MRRKRWLVWAAALSCRGGSGADTNTGAGTSTSTSTGTGSGTSAGSAGTGAVERPGTELIGGGVGVVLENRRRKR